MAEAKLSDERADRAKAIERILSRENYALIEEGIKAYKRELPDLLACGKQNHVVAYRGPERVGIARTNRQLQRQLAREGITSQGELFIIHVAPLEDEREHRVRAH